MEQVRMCTFFSCKYAPWEFDSEIIIPSCILLERWSETNRPDNFLFPVSTTWKPVEVSVIVQISPGSFREGQFEDFREEPDGTTG